MKKYVGLSIGRVFVPILGWFIATSASTIGAEIQSAQVLIQEVKGTASYSTGGSWQPLKQSMKLTEGAVIRTEGNSTVDLLFNSSGTALRLTPDSRLRLDKLRKERGGEQVITDTSLTLLSGSVAGAQRKLSAPSRFEIQTAMGVATIVGTEYYVRADGAVTVVSGAVSLNLNKPHNGGSVKATVNAGFSFDPATGKVVPTTPGYLQNIIAHITTSAHSAEVFKVAGATLIVKPEKPVSPSQGGADDDNDQGKGQGKGNGNGNGNGNNGNGNGNGNNGNGNGKGKGH
jgi:hypothetical protein